MYQQHFRDNSITHLIINKNNIIYKCYYYNMFYLLFYSRRNTVNNRNNSVNMSTNPTYVKVEVSDMDNSEYIVFAD